MTKQKSTKRSLLLSALSMLMCLSLFVGSTFAWFTDSVVSGENKIVAGNLDIELEYYDENDEWTTVDGATNLFDETLWEPGHTDVVYLRLKNVGSLALKYKLSLSVASETPGINVYGDEFLLSDYIRMGVVKDVQPSFASRDEARAAVTNNNGIIGEGYAAAGEMTKDADDLYMAVVVYMPESVDNKANYRGEKVPTIDFGINLVATQLTHEKDSFDNSYDKDAKYPNPVKNAAELADALANGKDAVLSGDIVDAPVNTRAPYGNYYGVALNGGVLDGNGNRLDFNEGELHNNTRDNYGIMVSAGTIKNVDITGVFRGIVIMYPTDDIYIDNVTIGGEDVCYAINTAEGDGTHSLIVTNSTIAGWNSYGDAIKDLSFTDCTFAQGEYYTNVYGRLVKPYVTTVFENCEFSSKYYIDLSDLKNGCTITLKNCTVNGVKLTAANWKDLIVAENDCGNGQISIEGKDGTYMSTSNIFDYVVID